MSDFDWNDTESIAVGEQLAIAVYENPRGDVVIRQANWPEDDVWIVLNPANAAALCRALMREAGIEQTPMPLLPAPARSAAERSRKYRMRHGKRDGSDELLLPLGEAAE